MTGRGDTETRGRGEEEPEDKSSVSSPRVSASPRPRVPLIIGHRGAAAVAPENTLVSFERALADGADGVEFDVRLAQDGVPVVIHDATLRRTALMRGRVSSFSSTELAQLDAGTWFNLRRPRLARPEYARATIPTLAAVFELMKTRDALLYVEMKCGPRDRAALAAEVVKLVHDYSFGGRVVVESFDLPSIAEVKRLDAGLSTAALFDRRLSRPAPSARGMMTRAINCGADEIALHHSLATRRTVQEAARHNLRTVVWTADNPSWVLRALRGGVRAVITNDPAGLCARRAELLAGE